MNTTAIIGRLAHQPELRYTNGGTAVLNLRLAVRNPRDDDKPYWIPVVAYGKVAEATAAHRSKGDQVAVTGELTSNEWTDTEGAKHSRVEVKANAVDFLARKRTDTGADQVTDEEPF